MSKSIVLFAITSLVSVAAFAEDPPPPPFTGNINVTSNYKFRGQDQGNGKSLSPAVQGGFDYAQNGFYVGNWNSNISYSNASLEMDFYGGYKGDIIKDSLSYDVGIYQYYYPQKDRATRGIANYNTTEIYGALSYGPATLKYSHTVSKDYFGAGYVSGVSTYSGRNTGYLDLSVNQEVAKGLTVNGHIGYTHLASDLRSHVLAPDGVTLLPSYYDYKLGVTYDLGSGFSVAGALVGANKQGAYSNSAADISLNKTRFIATLSKAM